MNLDLKKPQTPFGALISTVVGSAKSLREAKADLLAPEAIAMLRAKLDPIADQLDMRQQFAPTVANADRIPLSGVDPNLQAAAEQYRSLRKIDAMMGNQPGTALRRSLERDLNESYGMPADTPIAE